MAVEGGSGRSWQSDVVHPEKLGEATSKKYLTLIGELRNVPMDPNFPFYLEHNTKGWQNSFVVFIAPSDLGRLLGIAPYYGDVVEVDSIGAIDDTGKRVKFADIVARLIQTRRDSKSPVGNDVFARPEHNPPFLKIINPDTHGSATFKIKECKPEEIPSAEDLESAITNSRKMAEALRDGTYCGPRARFQVSRSVLDFVRGLQPK